MSVALRLTLASSGPVSQRASSEGGKTTSLVVRPLIEIASDGRDKDERVGRGEKRPMIPDFKVFGHLVTSQARSITEYDHMFFFRQ